jgi:hypothetical protein
MVLRSLNNLLPFKLGGEHRLEIICRAGASNGYLVASAVGRLGPTRGVAQPLLIDDARREEDASLA